MKTRLRLRNAYGIREIAKESALKFKREFKDSTNTAIVAALGFLIALSWKDVITEVMSQLSGIDLFKSKVMTATVITIISVIGILFISKINERKRLFEP
jgi:Cft2 family RNA processing exonuclease